MKSIIKYIVLIIVSALLINYLTLFIWGKENLLFIAAEDFNWNATDQKIDLVIWNGVLPKDESYNSLEDFNDSQIKAFINIINNNGLVSTITYKPKNIQIDSIRSKKNELNLMVFYKMNYLFYCELYISAYSPGFITDKTEYLFWFFGWHRFTEPQFGVS
jgi:hypothetical protein